MFKIITKEEYFKQDYTTAIAADPSRGIMSKTYVLLEGETWANLSGVLSFVQKYWAGINEDSARAEPMQEKRKDILEERQGTHGEFKDVAPISQTLKIYFREQPSWESLTDVQQEALDNIAQKIARIFAGNHNFPDHWIDIQGYAKLAQQEIEKNGDRPSSLSEKV